MGGERNDPETCQLCHFTWLKDPTFVPCACIGKRVHQACLRDRRLFPVVHLVSASYRACGAAVECAQCKHKYTTADPTSLADIAQSMFGKCWWHVSALALFAFFLFVQAPLVACVEYTTRFAGAALIASTHVPAWGVPLYAMAVVDKERLPNDRSKSLFSYRFDAEKIWFVEEYARNARNISLGLDQMHPFISDNELEILRNFEIEINRAVPLSVKAFHILATEAAFVREKMDTPEMRTFVHVLVRYCALLIILDIAFYKVLAYFDDVRVDISVLPYTAGKDE